MSNSGGCGFSECELASERGGYCRGHYGQIQRGETLRPLALKPSGYARLEEAALAYADAEEDAEYKRARDNLRKAAQAATGRGSFSEAIQRGLAAAKARGVRLGRPANVDPQQAVDLSRMFGVRKAATMLGATAMAVWRAKRRVTER